MIRVLICDDQDVVREGLRTILSTVPGIEVVGLAEDGARAVELFDRHKPDVVLMDLNMPEMGGIAATRAIKAEQPDITVLALTVSEAEEDVVEMVTAGASAYVLKDVDPERLARSIRDAHAGRFLLDDALTRRVILRLGANLRRPERETLATRLTEKERVVLKMVMQGKSNRSIGDQLKVSEGTVKTHLRNVYRKLHVDGRAAAAAAGARLDL